MTTEEQDYEHLSRILDSYVLRNDERHRRFVYSELILIARLRNTSLETVTQETANAVGEQANNPDIKEFIRQRMLQMMIYHFKNKGVNDEVNEMIKEIERILYNNND